MKQYSISAGEVSPQKIISLRAENVKRLRAVELNPNGENVVVGGRNAQGKSSLLDAIAMAIGGLGQAPKVPIRAGEKRASVLVKTEEFVVERIYTEGSDSLVVRDAHGTRMSSPQTLLNKFTGSVSFDPLAFLRLSPKDQAEQLRQLVGLDFTELDAAAARAYDGRTLVNRDLKVAKMRLASLPAPVAVGEGVPSFEEADGKLVAFVAPQPDCTDIAEAIAGLDTAAAEREDKKRELLAACDRAVISTQRAEGHATTAAAALRRASVAYDNAKDVAKAAQAALDAANLSLERASKVKADAQGIWDLNKKTAEEVRAANNEKDAEAQKQLQELAQDADAAAGKKRALEAERARRQNAAADAAEATRAKLLEARDKAAEAERQRVRNKAYADANDELARLEDKSAKLTDRLIEIAAAKAAMIAYADFPVKGLSFDAEGWTVLLDGIPFAQASSAEQLRTCVAIAAAANPVLRVMLIRDGSLLDEDSLKLLFDLAREKDLQVWIERVGKDEHTSVVIEDGAEAIDEKGGLL
jgi:hypothetical protein